MIKTHFFEVKDAKKYGVNKAILLYNIRYWLEKNKANRSNIKKHKDKQYYWTYNSAQAFSKLFPYMARSSINRWLKELEKDGIIISSQFNKAKYDKTKWYTLPEYQTNRTIAQNKQSVEQNEQPIPNINTNNNNQTCKKPTNIQLIVKKYAEAIHGELDENDYEKLKESYGRHARDAKDLLSLCDGSVEKASEAIDQIKKWADNEGLSWNIGTAVKRFHQLDPNESRKDRYKRETAKYPTLQEIINASNN